MAGATPKQIKYINDLIDMGASIPSTDSGNLDDSMYSSIEAADAFIKKWKDRFKEDYRFTPMTHIEGIDQPH